MREGLYKADFRTLTDEGTGVAYLKGGQVWGGDAALFYVGTYSHQAGTMLARVKVNRHSEGVESVFGRDKNTIKLEGPCTDSRAELEGRADQASGVSFNVKLTWLPD